MQTLAEEVKENDLGGQTQPYPSSLEDSTSLILFSGDRILNATAFHLNSRGPDSDLLFFPAEIILFHFCTF